MLVQTGLLCGVVTMRLLDLFCGAGGAAMGYSRAGFTEIIGVDNRPQSHYPFTFVQADALEYVAEHGHKFDAIHASPPCQAYSVMRNLPWLQHRDYPTLLLPVSQKLRALNKPYVIENVMGVSDNSRNLVKFGLVSHGLSAGFLCGLMFGKTFFRHRLFATNWLWLAPGHPNHNEITHSPLYVRNRSVGALSMYSRRDEVQHVKGYRLASLKMGINWMNYAELCQAIPPVYTEFIGKSLLGALES